MRMNKLGAELSVNVIIIAIIALVVLVVLFAVFTGRMAIWNKGVNALQKQCPDGRIVDKMSDCSGLATPITYKDSSGNIVTKYCCTK